MLLVLGGLETDAPCPNACIAQSKQKEASTKCQDCPLRNMALYVTETCEMERTATKSRKFMVIKGISSRPNNPWQGCCRENKELR